MKHKSARIGVTPKFDVNLDDAPDVLQMIDELRVLPSGEKLSRAALVRDVIRKAHKKIKK